MGNWGGGGGGGTGQLSVSLHNRVEEMHVPSTH